MTPTREQLLQVYGEEVVTMHEWAGQWINHDAVVQLVQDSWCRLLYMALMLQQTPKGPLVELYDIANRIVGSWVVAGSLREDLPLWLDAPELSADRQLRFAEIFGDVTRALHRVTANTVSLQALQEPLRADIAYQLSVDPQAVYRAPEESTRRLLARLAAAFEGASHLSRDKESFLTDYANREVSRTYLGGGRRVPQTRSERHGQE